MKDHVANCGDLPADDFLVNHSLDAIMQKTREYTPYVKEYPDFRPSYPGITAITYDAPPVFPNRYKTFAYLGIPEGKDKVPAVVLVHGRTGQAYLEWVKQWMKRGYAAIAMSLEGFYPVSPNSGDHWVDGSWHYGEYGVFDGGEMPSPQNDEMQNAGKPFENQWMTHAVMKVIGAYTVLRSLDRIDKIGVCGVSWGGVITSLAIGWESRFDFAIPIYLGGYMEENRAYIGSFFQNPETQKSWLFKHRLYKGPILWLCGDEDTSVSANTHSHSYVSTKEFDARTRLSVLRDFSHSHIAAADREEPYLFADMVAKNGTIYPSLSAKWQDGAISASVDCGDGILSATLYYMTEPYTYQKFDKYGKGAFTYPVGTWQSTKAAVSGMDIGVRVPEDASAFYLAAEVESVGKTYTVSSVLWEK